MKSINCQGTLIDLNKPKVMGILNITPDSFFDGGQYNKPEKIIQQVQKMLEEGATFIDVGAYSSRPGAQHIAAEEEQKRILPVVKLLVQEFENIRLSVDTFRSEIARACVQAGACMVNDISGGEMDPTMFKTLVELQVPYICMHMQGIPQNMQEQPSYEDITRSLIRYFSEKAARLHTMGLNDLIIDVGFGFGKTVEHNYTLLNKLDLFKALELPMLVGISRKSMLFTPLNSTPGEALNATTSANTIALLKGANILRVHDVKQAAEACKIVALTHQKSDE